MESGNETVFALIPVTLIGAVLNWSVLYSIHKIPSLKNSFGCLSANQTLVDALHSSVFLLYFCPMVLLDQPTMKAYSHFVGGFLLFCYELSVLTHCAISINRFCAVWFPLGYVRIFTVKNSRYLIGSLWILNGTNFYIFYFRLCHVYYVEEIHFVQFTNSEFCTLVAYYDDLMKNAAIVVLIMCIDISTVMKVRSVQRKIASSMGREDDQKFTPRDIRFLKQTVFQGCVFLLELLTYFFVPSYTSNRWVIFFATSFAWVSVHAADGVVVIVCNPEVRKFILRQKEVPQPSATLNTFSTAP